MRIGKFTKYTSSFLALSVAASKAAAASTVVGDAVFTVGPALAQPAVATKFSGVIAVDARTMLLVPAGYPNFVEFDTVSNTVLETAVAPGVGSARFRGAVLLPTGQVLFIPHGHNRFVTYDLFQKTAVQSALILGSTNAYSGGAVLPDGRVVLAPSSLSKIGIYTPATEGLVEGPDIGTGYGGATMLPDGRVLFQSTDSNRVATWNPTTNAVIIVAATETFGGLIRDVRLAHTGLALLSPGSGRYPYVFDYRDNSVRKLSQLPSQVDKYGRGAWSADGNIYYPPDQNPSWGVYDVASGKFSNGPASPGGKAFGAAALASDGRIICAPRDQANIGILTPSPAVVAVPEEIRLNWYLTRA
jgi:hypothetical protein